ncbi:hypothetical protein BDV93DRAFT_587563 [Ceratobasidium sp. AG-I]|nr:hypothetical protein BDV93DRAFT_587563 [Ceratobasidium sp. AG-I]
MASPPRDIFYDAVHHVFLPPELPQQAPQDDAQRLIDLELVDLVRQSVEAYKKTDSTAHEQWSRMSQMLSHLASTIDVPLATNRLQHDMSSMKDGDIIALYIRAQNCVVLLRKQSAATLFEVFEVQAPNEDVMSNPGKLVRSFPGRAVEVPNSVTDDPGYFAEIANFLVQMDKDVLKGSTATTTKAGSEVVEVRDSAHPHYISQFFLGILRGMRKEVEPRRVDKRIADEILWDSAYKPWRRSPIWLITPDLAFLTQLLCRAHGMKEFSSDLLFAMRVKMARRLFKVQASAPKFVVDIAKTVAEETEGVLQARWTEVQRAQEVSPPWNPTTRTFEESIKQSLPNSCAYVEEVSRGRSSTNAPSSFSPSHRARLSNVQNVASFSNGALNLAFSADSHVALFDFEDSVHNHLETWTSNNLHTPTACGVIASCLERYTTLARSHYTMDVADKSIMVLTIMELWVALNRLATSQCPLLLDYSPEFGEQLLEPLLLRTSIHIEQAGMVQRHLRQRQATAQQAGKGSVFSDEANQNSFAVQYFQNSSDMRELKRQIELKAQRQRDAKIEEMHRRNEEHRQLVDRASRMMHEYWYNRCDWNCKKCSVEKQASNMRIDIREWPLPPSRLDAELVVFELMCPSPVRIWRDETYKIVRDIGSSNHATASSWHCTLADYDGLSEWSSGLRSSARVITIASFTRPFIRSHYSSTSFPTYESTVCVKNGLAFKLHDTSEQNWSAGPFTGTSFAKHGAMELPAGGGYQHLRSALESTGHTSNQILADQFDCPRELSLHEHIAFGTLRSGPRLQWMNIARGLEENLLTFNRYEVLLLHNQDAWQIGPLLQDGRARDWHTELESANFGHLLISQSLELLRQVKANWLEANSVRSISGKMCWSSRCSRVLKKQGGWLPGAPGLPSAPEYSGVLGGPVLRCSLVLRSALKRSRPREPPPPLPERSGAPEPQRILLTVILVTRLLTSTNNSAVHQDAYAFLREARGVTFRWLQELLKKLQDAEIDSQILDYQARVCEMAAICRSTYDVDVTHLGSLLSTSGDLSTLVMCSVSLYDNQPPKLSDSPNCLQTLLCRDRRLTHKALPMILERIQADPRVLDHPVSQLWPDYHAGLSGWMTLSEPNSRWVATTTGGVSGQLVHLNMLEGRLLIKGKPLGRLPREYVSHPSYARLFGQKVLDVVPAHAPGMEFATRTRVNDYQISFALNTSSNILLVQAQKDGHTYELIPHTVLASDFPVFLSSDYHHWADVQAKVLEFRPLTKPWHINPRNWRLKFLTKAGSVMELFTDEGSLSLADVHSLLFRSIAKRLAPLENHRYLHVAYSPTRQINVELPRMKLSFFINDDRDLESHNMRRQIADSNQSSGIMLGLRNQLLLRAKDPAAQNLPQSRTVLIPHGIVYFSTDKNHVSVTIDVGTDRKVAFRQYKVDTDLRYLASTTSLTSRLFKIYLHALTNYCLPDPLTGRTGTEEALYELSEPAISSFEQITKEQAALLKLIGALTPVRKYYPVHLESMQTVRWNSLPPLSQHYAFVTIAESILHRADALRLFHPLDFEPMSYVGELEQTLLERSAHRSRMYYPPETTARLSTILDGKDKSDHAYTGRDCNVEERAQIEHAASWISRLTFDRWNQPTFTSCDLVSQAESWGDLNGPSKDLSLTYSSSWLDLNLPRAWLSIYNLCRHANSSGNRYQLAACLASASYSNGLSEAQIHALLAFTTNPTFRDSPPPNYPSYRLADGYEPKHSRVEQLVVNHTRDLDDSPASNMFSRDSESAYEFRRRKLEHYNEQVPSLKSQFVASLMNQWPNTQPQASSNYASWFNITPCITEVRQYFTSRSKNTELRKHLQLAGKTLFARSSTADLGLPVLPTAQLGSPREIQATIDPLDSLAPPDLMKSRMCPKLSSSPAQSRVDVPETTKDPADTSRLASLLKEFRDRRMHPLHARYGSDPEESRVDLTAAKVVRLPNRLPASEDLSANREGYQRYMRSVFVEIYDSLGPLTPVEQVIAVAGVWPCRTPRAILRRLSLWGRHSLPEDWKQALMTYARAFVEYQRTQHLIRLAREDKREEFFKELDIESPGPNAAAHDPDWLLVQIDGNFRARDVQSKVANEMISPSSGANTVLQLNMGEGKSSVIVPIIASALADSSRLVRVVVLKPLWKQMFELLVSRLAGLAGRRVYYLPFGRHIRVGSAEAQRIQGMYGECMREGGILLVQPEHILSFKLMGIDRLTSSSSPEDTAVAYTLRNMQSWLTTHSWDILDESDEILHIRYQLVYTVGQQQPLEDHPDRWTTTQQIFPLVSRHILSLKSQFPDSFNFGPSSGGQFPLIRIMPDAEKAVEILVLAVARDALDGKVPNLNFVRLSPSVRAMALRFLTAKDFPEPEYRLLKEECDISMWKGLLLLRGLLASGILVFALKEKHYRVDYGLNPSRSLLAVPYHAKDIPSLRAEFGHPDVAIVLTCLSYYYQGLTNAQLDTCFEILYKLDNPTLEYEQWVHANNDTPQGLRHLNGINIKDREQFTKVIVPAFAHNAAVVNFYLLSVAFPKEAKEFPHKLATSGWDLAQAKVHIRTHVTTGFSGTKDNQHLLRASIAQADPVKQSSTNALVLSYLLQPENNHYTSTSASGETCLAKDFLKLLVGQKPEIQDLVRCWLEMRPEISAAVFVSDKDELMVPPQNGTSVPLVTSPFAQQLDKCIVYLDDGHTRGTDLKLPTQTRAVVTLGPKVTKDRLLQGCMRMRKLGHGQSVMFFAPAEIDSQAMLNTCHDLEHHISHWAQQGVEYKRRAETEQQYLKTKNVSVLKEGWTTPESRPLEEMYGVSSSASSSSGSFTARARGFPDLSDRLDLLGVLSLDDPSMDEGQEREVSHEVERERQIERPPKSQSASHSIHKDLKTFVLNGSVTSHSPCFVSLFHPLQSRLQDLPVWSNTLLATADFCKTIANLPSNQLNEYMRPLNWLLSGPNGVLMALSTFEVNELLPQIRSSRAVRLHVYAARVTHSMRSFSDLGFYSVPSLPTSGRVTPFPAIQLQLNLWAGQLYFEDHGEYLSLCAFLGICMDTDGHGGEEIRVQGDGFVLPADRQVLAVSSRICGLRILQQPSEHVEGTYGPPEEGDGVYAD